MWRLGLVVFFCGSFFVIFRLPDSQVARCIVPLHVLMLLY